MNGDLNLEIITWFSEKDDGTNTRREKLKKKLHGRSSTNVGQK